MLLVREDPKTLEKNRRENDEKNDKKTGMAESHRSAGASEESKESVSFGGRACEDAHQWIRAEAAAG